MDFDARALVVGYVVFLFSTTLHEYGHALIGHRLGSRFATQEGLTTLNPIPHIKRSPFGMVVLPLLSVVYFGWMWPMGWASVPYDPVWAGRNPRQSAWMSLAGPAGNFIIAAFAFAVANTLLATGVLAVSDSASYASFLVAANGDPGSLLTALGSVLGTLIFMNLALGVFNLLPIPPLDGSGVLSGLFPKEVAPLYDKLREVPFVGIILFLIVFRYAWYVIAPLMHAVANVMM